jgi:hypothetical protein
LLFLFRQIDRIIDYLSHGGFSGPRLFRVRVRPLPPLEGGKALFCRFRAARDAARRWANRGNAGGASARAPSAKGGR